MPKGSRQKLKLLYLMDILYKQTDEKHIMNTSAIISELARYGIDAERKSIYSDIDNLQEYGCDIIRVPGSGGGYFVASRDFELPELKLLVDAVQASKFITVKKSNELIAKIVSLASKYDAGQLRRQVYVSNRVKSMNEGIYNVDKLHRAMNENREISFCYFDWTRKKEKKLRHNGKRYRMSPWSLCWEDENYYMIAYDDETKIIKHFRVDKMLDINILLGERKGRELFCEFDSAVYSKRIFGMFGGTPELVTLRCTDRLCGVIIDRFGRDVTMIDYDDEHFEVSCPVCVSRPFFSWVFQFGGDIRIVAPDSAVSSYNDMLKNALDLKNS